MTTRSRVLGIAVAIILAFIGWVFTAFEGTTKKAIGLDHVDWLPSSAHDIPVRGMLQLKPITSIDGIEIDMVTNAEVYNNRRANGGGITVVYDRDAERMYVTQSQR